MNYDDGDYSQGYGQNKEAFRALTKDDVLNLYLSDNEFRSSTTGNDIGYIFYVFNIRYQKYLENAQPTKVHFKFSENVPAGLFGYALVIRNKLVSISTDGQSF